MANINLLSICINKCLEISILRDKTMDDKTSIFINKINYSIDYNYWLKSLDTAS